jgi:hypothetical protein
MYAPAMEAAAPGVFVVWLRTCQLLLTFEMLCEGICVLHLGFTGMLRSNG